MNNAELNSDIRELTQDELSSVTGGLIWVHLARTAAILIAGGITVVREAMKEPEIQIPDITQVL